MEQYKCYEEGSSSPCLGILFSQENDGNILIQFTKFSSPCLGILFSHDFLWFEWDFIYESFSSPCLGILFSQDCGVKMTLKRFYSFRPHVWGFFFHDTFEYEYGLEPKLFSSPCLGILFSRYRSGRSSDRACLLVFVPMFGDSFFTADLGCPTGWAFYGPFAAGISN